MLRRFLRSRNKILYILLNIFMRLTNRLQYLIFSGHILNVSLYNESFNICE